MEVNNLHRHVERCQNYIELYAVSPMCKLLQYQYLRSFQEKP